MELTEEEHESWEESECAGEPPAPFVRMCQVDNQVDDLGKEDCECQHELQEVHFRSSGFSDVLKWIKCS